MPIRLNLLAEEKLAEEARRRDPVKRAMVIAIMIVLLEIGVIAARQLAIIRMSSDLKGIKTALQMQTNTYAQILSAERQLQETQAKLTALARACTNRFLWGSFLNALQKSIVNGVQLLKFTGSQTYFLTEAVKPRTEDGRTIPGKPATSTERIVITLDARDEGPGEGDNIITYIMALQENPHLKELLGAGNKVQLVRRLPPVEDPETKAKHVEFTLELRVPDRVRQ